MYESVCMNTPYWSNEHHAVFVVESHVIKAGMNAAAVMEIWFFEVHVEQEPVLISLALGMWHFVRWPEIAVVVRHGQRHVEETRRRRSRGGGLVLTGGGDGTVAAWRRHGSAVHVGWRSSQAWGGRRRYDDAVIVHGVNVVLARFSLGLVKDST